MIEVGYLRKLGARPRQAAERALAAFLASCLCLCLCLGGCGIRDPASPAVDLYHNLQGGVIAQQRPPPPGMNDPYPNLGTIPKRPTAPDIAAQQKVADQLAAERDAAQRAAAASPLVAAATPPPAQPAKLAAPDPNASRVLVDAAPTPPATPAVPAAPAASTQARLADVPTVPQAITSGPLPTFAAAPPPLPIGVALMIPLPPPAPAVAPEPAAAPAAANTVVVAFTPGSATLPPSANLNLRRFALAHKGVPLTAIGHGEAVLAPPDIQARALELALHRAQAIAAALGDAGVPASNLRVRAEAAGQGGAATL